MRTLSRCWHCPDQFCSHKRDQEHFRPLTKPWLLRKEETFTIFVFVLVKHFSLGCLAEGYVRIILVYRCFHCNNPELIVWKLHQSRAPALETRVNSKYTLYLYEKVLFILNVYFSKYNLFVCELYSYCIVYLMEDAFKFRQIDDILH